jgi:hypothetical protein
MLMPSTRSRRSAMLALASFCFRKARMPGLILPRDSLRLDTRQRNHIENSLDRSTPTAGVVQYAEALKGQYVTAKHRPTFPCNTDNCHGLTFASRRTGISDSAVVQKILTEDGYEKINDRRSLSPGDVVLYISPINNDIEHSGIVVDADQTDPLRLRILSKWGPAHEVIHSIGDCPYDARNVAFYRMTR